MTLLSSSSRHNINVLSTQKNVLKHVLMKLLGNSVFFEFIVVGGKYFTKEVIISSFCRAHCSKLSVSNKSVKNNLLNG